MDYTVAPLDKALGNDLVERHHYLHRRPSNSYCFGLFDAEEPVGVCVFGTPASRHLQVGVCPSAPSSVIELNRLWLRDECPPNSESFFVARCLAALPPLIVVSYADTTQGHVGTIYRALNFAYAGWTDMDRKTPRYDYIVDGAHTRDAFRGGAAKWTRRERRRPKARYWTTTGNRRERRALVLLCCWPSLDWSEYPVPAEHIQFKET